jgi:hypothetical protein
VIAQFARQLRLHIAVVVIGAALVAVAWSTFSSSSAQRLLAGCVAAVLYGAVVLLATREISRRGYLTDDKGRLQLSKKHDEAWQATVFDLYDRIGEVVRSRHDYDPFVVYGTLLGQVREGGFIGIGGKPVSAAEQAALDDIEVAVVHGIEHPRVDGALGH